MMQQNEKHMMQSLSGEARKVLAQEKRLLDVQNKPMKEIELVEMKGEQDLFSANGECWTVTESANEEQELLRKYKDAKLSLDDLINLAWQKSNEEEDGIREVKNQKDDLEKIPAMKMYRELLEANSYVLIDGLLYAKNGFAYQPLVADNMMAYMRATLDSKFDGVLLHINVRKFYRFFAASPNFVSYSLREVLERFGRFAAFQNGILDFISLTFYPKGKNWNGYRTEEIVCLHPIAANYIERPGATPIWNNFLQRACGGDEEVKQRIVDMMSLILKPGNDIKQFYVLGLAPDSGKSTLADFLESFFEAEDVSRMDMHEFAGKYSLASIYNKAVNVSMDLTDAPLNDRMVSNVKILTGEKCIQIEKKFCDSRHVNVHCKLVFGTNFALKLKHADKAFWNRLEIIPFEVSIPVEEQQRNLLECLSRERDFVVSNLMQNLNRMAEHGYQLSYCAKAEQMKRQWMADSSDSLEMFLEEHCIITNNVNDRIPVRNLYEKYAEYVRNRLEEPCKANVFSREVHKHLCDECRYRKNTVRLDRREDPVRLIFGIRIKEEIV